MIRGLCALGVLLAAGCGGTSVREIPLEQGRYDALDAESLRELRAARTLLESGHAEEACRWYRQSAALFDELAARGAQRSDSRQEAEQARRSAAACGR